MGGPAPVRKAAAVNPAMKSWVRRWVKDTMTKLGYPELGEEVTITWRRMVSKVGLSEWQVHRKVSSGKKLRVSGFELVFSASLWPHIPKEERYETVVHECCHLVDAIEGNDSDDPHGDHWISLMHRLGRLGEATVSVEHLSVSRDVIEDLMQKCSICGEPGHNSRTCKRRETEEGKKLNELLKN